MATSIDEQNVERLLVELEQRNQVPNVDSIYQSRDRRKSRRLKIGAIVGCALIAGLLGITLLSPGEPDSLLDLAGQEEVDQTDGSAPASRVDNSISTTVNTPSNDLDDLGTSSTTANPPSNAFGDFGTSQAYDEYLSLSLEEAGSLAVDRAWVWRVFYLDGEHQRLRANLERNRLNFAVEDGLVVGVLTDLELNEWFNRVE